jgi:hypothetical protein
MTERQLPPRAMRGDLRADEMCLKVMKAEAKLLGLDTPDTSDQRIESIVITSDERRCTNGRF